MSSASEHMKQRTLLPLLIIPLLAAFFVAAPQVSHPAQSAESYAVYSVLIPQVQSVPQPKYLIANETLPYAHTKSGFPVEPQNIVTREEFDRELRLSRGTPAWGKIWKSQPCILVPEAERDTYLSAMMDYRRNNEVGIKLESGLDLPKSYELVDVSELVGEKKGKRWELAKEKGAYGIYEVSAVGFSSDMTLAIVYVGYDCPLCGRWALHVLKKVDGKWKQIAERCDVMS
jgi:hypothetical protein